MKCDLPQNFFDASRLDPPFKSNQDYNVLFAEKSGERSAAQIRAFEDTWHWDQAAEAALVEVVEAGGNVSQAMQAFRTFLGKNDMLAYLAMMAPRLVELRRVLKSTASIYLHCDPTASHYLKTLMDAVFEPTQFRSEIIWKRTSAHSSARRYGPVHDVILFFSKSDKYQWMRPTLAHDPEYIEGFFRQRDPVSGRRFHANVLTGAGVRHGESGKPWRGYNPTEHNRHWALPARLLDSLGIGSGTVQERLDALDEAGMVWWPKKVSGQPRLKYYAEDVEKAGMALPDVWTDIAPLSGHSAEKLSYPTQKPETLLERIISASSKEGDIVLDPFCGCGTTISVAERLKRHWIGIDITHLAIALMKHRLRDAFGSRVKYTVIGEPVDLDGAKTLAREDPYQFQWWALGLVGARPVEQRKGADRGIDGRLYFHDEGPGGKTKQVILSVKSGGVSVRDVRDLVGVVDREKAEIGVLISLETPTREMTKEAVTAGLYTTSEFSTARGAKYSRVQVLTIKELLGGKSIEYPVVRANVTFKRAPKAKAGTHEPPSLFGEIAAEGPQRSTAKPRKGQH